jgi:hypothetical protein
MKQLLVEPMRTLTRFFSDDVHTIETRIESAPVEKMGVRDYIHALVLYARLRRISSVHALYIEMR